MTKDLFYQFVADVKSGNLAAVASHLEQYEELRAKIDAPEFDFDSPAIVAAKHNCEMVALLLEHGADINARSNWWAGSFGILDGVDPETFVHHVNCGATANIYNAAEQGDLEQVREMLEEDMELANQPFGDGQCALHVAANTEVAKLLLDNGADPDRRCLDHSSTAAQYQIGNQDVLRLLIESGATPDIFMACRLGDRALIETILQNEPDALTSKVGRCSHTRPRHTKAHLHIYFWQLRCETPLEALKQFGHQELYAEYFERCPANHQLIAACWNGDREQANRVTAKHPDVMKQVTPEDQKTMARAAWENKIETVQMMLDLGFDPHVKGPEESTPLDRAAFHGYFELVKLLLERDNDPPLATKNKYGGTPLGACIYGSVHSWIKDSDHKSTAEALIAAGAPFDESWLPTCNPEFDELLNRHLK